MRLRDLTLVFNGEVYNFAELRGELEGHGYAFASRSDTEVVLAALEHWGTGALDRFNGMFALALVDRGRRRALLARDRFGKKPLFFGRLRGGVHFASELKSLLRVARDELTLCPDALAEYFRFQYVPAPRSIFREVSKLPPASWVEVDLDSGAVGEPVTYWSLPPRRRRRARLARGGRRDGAARGRPPPRGRRPGRRVPVGRHGLEPRRRGHVRERRRRAHVLDRLRRPALRRVALVGRRRREARHAPHAPPAGVA